MPPAERGTLLATLLFTDIVGSTMLADELGDRRWRELLARHHGIVRRELKRFNGRELDTAGDGFFAAFTKPAEGIRCAAAIVDGTRELGIEIRAGLHMGEAEVFGAKLSGVTVHIAARTMAAAGPGEVMVTSVLRDLVPGSGFGFEDRGSNVLKSIPGEWRLFAVTSVDGQPRSTGPDPEQRRQRLAAIQPPKVPRRARVPLVAVLVALVAAAIIVPMALGSGRGAPSATPTTVSSATPPKGQLVVVDPGTRKPTATVPLDFTPGPIAFAEGSVWILDKSANRVVRFDAVTRRVEATIKVGKGPVDLAVGAGSIWVANHFGRSVSRIDPGTNEVVMTIETDFLPSHIAAGDGAVWVDETGLLGPADPYPRAGLATIEPATNRVVDSVRFRAATDCAPSLGARSDVGWAATAFGQIWRLGPHGGTPAVLAETPHIAVAGMLVIEDGSMWLGSDGSPANVLSFDPSAKGFSDLIPVGTTKNRGGPGCEPIWLILGGNYLWVTNADDRTLSVIATVSRQGVDKVPMDGQPVGLAFGVEQVWVAVDLP